MQGFLAYAAQNRILVAEGHDQVLVRRIVGRWRIGTLIYASAILLSFINTEISLAIYVFVLAFLVLQSAVGFRPSRATASD